MRPAKVVYVGLDACDRGIARALAREGLMPNLASFFERGALSNVHNPHGLFVGALWMSFATAKGATRHGFTCWDEVALDSYARRPTRPPEAVDTFWERLSDAGRRVAVLDVPHARVNRPIDGFASFEWGCHDRHFGFHTWPESGAEALVSAYGLHPILGVDAYAVREFAADDYVHREGLLRTPDEDKALLEGMLAGIEAKRRMSCDLLRRGGWDAFVTVFGESHAVGHQQWHLHDPTHVRFDPRHRLATGGDPLVQVYRALDGAVGELVEIAGDDAIVLVHLSHGMGAHHDGTHLLDEVLSRVDAFDRGTDGRDDGRRVLGALPVGIQRRFAACVAPLVRSRHARRPVAASPQYAEAEARARQAAYAALNNSVYGGVRFNVIGREPRGIVAPAALDAEMARVTDALHALVNVQTGGRVVARVERCDAYHPRSRTDVLPDLFVEWDRTSLVETVWSPKTGTVHVPYAHWRTGDHRPHGLLLGRGLSRGLFADVRVEDIGPTIARALGVTLEGMDGVPAPWMPRA